MSGKSRLEIGRKVTIYLKVENPDLEQYTGSGHIVAKDENTFQIRLHNRELLTISRKLHKNHLFKLKPYYPSK